LSACLFRFISLLSVVSVPEIDPLSLHDALPILSSKRGSRPGPPPRCTRWPPAAASAPPDVRRLRPLCAACCRRGYICPAPREGRDRKSTRLNSSHVSISYAVFCLKKKKEDSNFK